MTAAGCCSKRLFVVLMRVHLSGGVFYLGLAVIGVLAIPAAVLLGLIAGVWTLTDKLTAILSEKH